MSSPRVRMSPDSRREQLLDLGLRLLSSRPLNDLSIDDLAEEAGISRGLLYHYFGNKQDFHQAVVRRAADDLIRLTRPDDDLPPLERLAQGLAAYVDYVEQHHQVYATLVRGAAAGNEMLRQTYADARGALTGRIHESLGELGFTDGPRVRLLTNGWAAMVEDTVLAWVAERGTSKEEMLRLLTAALPAVLRATSETAAPDGEAEPREVATGARVPANG